MRILYHIDYLKGLGADRWIYEGYKHAFEDKGHEVFPLTENDDIEEVLKNINPNIFIAHQSQINSKNFKIFNDAKKRGVKIFQQVDFLVFNDPEKLEFVKKGIGDFYWDEADEERMEKLGFSRITGHKFFEIPNAANVKYNFPAQPVEKYKCDIVFLGAYMSEKKEGFKRMLYPLMKKYDVRLYGPGWTLRDNFLRGIGKIARKFGAVAIADFVNIKRVTILQEDENKLYASAKICINFHVRGRDGVDYALVNERAFKIPASGGFEISDYIPSLRRYFTEDEVVMAENEKDWFDKIDFFLKNDQERLRIQKKGTERALKDHLYHNRVDKIVSMYNSVNNK